MSKILITGSSGFLGSVVASYLLRLNHNLIKLGISDTDDIHCDLGTSIPILEANFDYMIHLAGKAHIVSNDPKEIADFFRINLDGTKNLLEGLEQMGKLPHAIVFMSSVAVYGVESGTSINEEHALLGKSPYAMSKIKAEDYLKKWCLKHGVLLAILRPTLVAGKNPPGNLGAMINGIKSGLYLRIGDGHSRRSLVMADDIAFLIPKLFNKEGTFNICDDYHPSLNELETLIANQLGKKVPISIPYWCAKCLALLGDFLGDIFPINSMKLNKISKTLTFSNKKAKLELDWKPLDVLTNFKIQ